MKITVQFMAQLKVAAGLPSVTIDVADGATMKDLAEKISVRFGNPLRAILMDETGRPRSGVLVFSNDDQVGWDAPVNSENVMMMSAISGG